MELLVAYILGLKYYCWQVCVRSRYHLFLHQKRSEALFYCTPVGHMTREML